MSDNHGLPHPGLGEGALRQLMAVLDQGAPVEAEEAIERATRRELSADGRASGSRSRAALRRAPALGLAAVLTAALATGLTLGLSGPGRPSTTATGRSPSFNSYLAAFNAQYAANPENPPVHASQANASNLRLVTAHQALVAVERGCNEGAGSLVVRAGLVRATFASGVLWAVFVDPPGQHLAPSTEPTSHPEVLNWYVGFAAGETGRVALCSFGRSPELSALPIVMVPTPTRLPPACSGLGFSSLPAGTRSTVSRHQALKDAHGLPVTARRFASFVAVSDPAYGQVIDGKVRPYFKATPAWVVWVSGKFPAAEFHRGPPPGPGTAVVQMTVLVLVNPRNGKQELLATC
jgi:hypothetical protein